MSEVTARVKELAERITRTLRPTDAGSWSVNNLYVEAALNTLCREVERETWDQVSVAQAVWQDNRADFYEQYGCATFKEWCEQQAAQATSSQEKPA